MTDRSSFDKVKYWVNELTSYEESASIIIVGTKKDLLASHTLGVNSKEVENYAAKINAKVIYTSSKTGENVDSVFETITRIIMAKPKPLPKEYAPVVVNVVHEETKCCI